LNIVQEVSSLNEKFLTRTILLDYLPLNAIPFELFAISCKRVNIVSVKDIVDHSREVISYINHDSTLKFLSNQLKVDLKTSSDQYMYRHGDILIVSTLKKQMSGSEITQISLEDIDVFMCIVQELPIQL